MKTQFEFKSPSFPPVSGEEVQINPGRFGKRLADFLADELAKRGCKVGTPFPEDWGWQLDIANESFPLWIGCGNVDGTEDEFLCFIEPSKPFVRKWLTKIPTTDVVNRLSATVEAVLRESGRVTDLQAQ